MRHDSHFDHHRHHHHDNHYNDHHQHHTLSLITCSVLLIALRIHISEATKSILDELGGFVVESRGQVYLKVQTHNIGLRQRTFSDKKELNLWVCKLLRETLTLQIIDYLSLVSAVVQFNNETAQMIMS